MPFLVQATIDDHTVAVTTATAKEAFAHAIEWHVVERFTDVSIYDDGTKVYSIDAFSVAMALLEIAKTVEATAEPGLKAKEK
jgi:hypothetical protein